MPTPHVPRYPDQPNGQPSAETARNERWNQTLAERLAAATGDWMRVRIATVEPVELRIDEVCREWMRASTRAGSTVFVPLAQLRMVFTTSADGRSAAVDDIAPSFRSALGELSRRRTEVVVHIAGDGLATRIHHVGRDYVQLDGAVNAIVPIAAIELVELRAGEHPQ